MLAIYRDASQRLKGQQSHFISKDPNDHKDSKTLEQFASNKELDNPFIPSLEDKEVNKNKAC